MNHGHDPRSPRRGTRPEPPWSRWPTREQPVVAAARSGSPPVRRRWWPGVALAVGASAVVLVAAGWAGALDAVPLLNGAAAASVEVAGVALLVAAWSRPERRWLRLTLPLLLAAVAALVGAIAFALRVTGTVTDAYPPSFAVWVGAALAALGGCPLVLRQAGAGPAAPWRRAAALVAVPLTLVGGFMLIDQEYGIWPQVGDVLDHSGALRGQQALHDLGARGGVPQQGVIVELDAPATRSHFAHRPGVVFLPPAYFGAARATLPVLVMLVGAPGTPINWLKSGHAQRTDDAYAAGHHGVAPVLVVVDQNGSATGDTECVNGPRGNAETYLAQDVPAFITGTLHLRHDPSRWGVVGFSEGGTCALDLVLGYPRTYRHAVDFGGDTRPNLGNPQHTRLALYGGSVAAQQAHDPFTLLARRHYRGVTVWFGAGREDVRGIAVGTRLAAATIKAGIPTHRFVGIDGHNWQFASDALARIFPALCADLRCTGPEPAGGAGPAAVPPARTGAAAALRRRPRARPRPAHTTAGG
jgi:S-formylglutathione hydrolase FrmB